MRKVLEALGLSALAWMAFITVRALYGPERLPSRIPTHFDLAGHANGWGSPAMLLALPGVALAVFLLMSWVAHSPQAFNYPVRVTPANRARLETLAVGMIVWIKAELACLFAWIQWDSVGAARHPHHGFPATAMPAALVAIFATIGWHVVGMFRAAPTRPR